MVSAFAKRVRSQLGAADLERRVNHYIQNFLSLSREGIVIGSEYAPDAVRRAMLAHQRQLSRLFGRPIWRNWLLYYFSGIRQAQSKDRAESEED